MVLVIIFGIVLPYEMYLTKEETESTVYLKTFGDTYGNINGKLYIWDNSNSEFNNFGVNNIFVPTRVKITYN